MQACSVGPLKVLKWVGPNAYINKGPAITSYDTFHGLITNPMTHPKPPNLLPTHKQYINTILDEQIVSRNEGVSRHLIRWK